MERRCPSCGDPIPVSAVDPRLGAGRCPACGTLVDFRGTAKPVLAQPIEGLIPIPSSLQVNDQDGGLHIRWRWLDGYFVITVVSMLFWNGLLAATIRTALREGASSSLVVFLPFACVGLALVYGCVASLFNSTDIRIERENLTVRHGPLPWPGNLVLPTRALRQLFVLQTGQSTITYDLCAVMADGRKRRLVRDIGIEDRARFLEHRIEAHLGITDRPVKGEIARP